MSYFLDDDDCYLVLDQVDYIDLHSGTSMSVK